MFRFIHLQVGNITPLYISCLNYIESVLNKDPNSAIGLGMLMMKDNEALPFKAMFVVAEIIYKDAKYLIEDIRTVKKEGSLNQVECKGVVKYFTLDKENSEG